ncbi:MAG: D-alanine--D-alanine ligase family protein [Nocardioides sp.]
MSEPTFSTGASRKPRVAVVFGGRSGEHAISCVTAGNVLAAIDQDKYDVIPIGIATDGRWVLESADPERLRITGAGQLPSVDVGLPSVTLERTPGGVALVTSDPSAPPRALGEVDVVFPLLHGPWGEDGTIQGMLEMAGIRYVGAGVLASAISMDKAFMKIALRAAGLPVMGSVVITAQSWRRDPAGHLAGVEALGYPVFVKPARGGSSLGITKVHGPGDLGAALEIAMEHDPKVLVEAAAQGAREIECGVLQDIDGTPRTSVPAEIRVGGDHEFYDFAAKYIPGEHTQLDVPAELKPDVEDRLREMAARAFEAVDCEGLVRVDFFVMPDDELIINELNTMPGFTPVSMFPRMWAASGVDYPALIDRLIQLALARDTGLR